MRVIIAILQQLLQLAMIGCFVTFFSACGTEVGNGWKAPDDQKGREDEPDKLQNTEAGTIQIEEEPAPAAPEPIENESEKSESVGEPDPDDQSPINDEPSGGGGSGDTGDTDENLSESDGNGEASSLHFLLADCASPFASMQKEEVTFQVDSTDYLTASFIDSAWIIVAEEREYSATPLSEFAIEAQGEQVTGGGYTCGEVSSTEGVSVDGFDGLVKFTVEISKGSNSAISSWYRAPETGIVHRIELATTGADPFVLKRAE